MAQFSKIGGAYVALQCTYEERFIFLNAKWYFDQKSKKWTTYSFERALDVIDYADDVTHDGMIDIIEDRAAAIAASWATDTDFEPPCPEGLAYLPFQKAGIEYALEGESTLIGDPPGLGKTVQAIGVNNCLEPAPTLVVCPASLKINWQREWEKWDVHGQSVGMARSEVCREPILEASGERMRDHEGKPMTRTWTELVWPDTDVVVINYDMLIKFDTEIKNKKWGLAIFDEAHALKTLEANRTKAVFGGTKKSRKKDGKVIEKSVKLSALKAAYTLYLTGTPILSRPVELWNLIRACDPKGLGKDFKAFAEEFCDAQDNGFGTDFSGSSNEEKLNKIMRERFLVRRNKTEVLKDLPPKEREIIVIPQDKLEKVIDKEINAFDMALNQYEVMMGMESTQGEFRYITAIEELSTSLGEALDSQGGEEPNWNKAVKSLSEPLQLLFTQISEAREEAALAKVGFTVDHIYDLYKKDEAVIAFAYHKSVVKAIAERLEEKGVKVGIITGSVSVVKRQQVVDAFQNGEIDVILGNILAMGVGHTLTRGRYVVFAEIDWVPALVEQAEDRAWRIGQLRNVYVQHLIVDGSIESRMVIAILDKMLVIAAVLDEKHLDIRHESN